MSVKLSISQKLLLVCASFLLPLAVLLGLFVRARLESIEFAHKELQGDAVLAPLKDVLVGAALQLNAEEGAAPRDRVHPETLRAERVSQLEGALGKVIQLEQAYQEELQLSPEGLARHGRQGKDAPGLASHWNSLKAAGTREERRRALASLDEHARAMMTHVGDSSNLILDPDLDSYYLMDAGLLALPALESRLAGLQSLSLDSSSSPAEAQTKATELALLRLDLEHLEASLKTSFDEDEHFYGESPSLRGTLEPALAEAARAVRSVLVEEGKPGDQLRPLPVRLQDYGTALRTVQALHEAALSEEDKLLGLRMDAIRGELLRGCIWAGLSVLLAALAAFVLASRLVKRVRRLHETTQALAQGDVLARAGQLGSDEIGSLARSFDEMTDRLQTMSVELESRAAELEFLNVNLERRVEQRTAEVRRKTQAIELILRNVSDGLFTLELDGTMSDQRSSLVDEWFELSPSSGGEPGGLKFAELLRAKNPRFADQFEFLLDEVKSGFLPLEVSLAQLPSELNWEGKHLLLSYRPILHQDKLEKLLVVIRDETLERVARDEVEHQQETLRIFRALQNDRAGFLDFMAEGQELVETILASLEHGSPYLARKVHTLKGTAGVSGVLGISKFCHELETRILEREINPQEERENLTAAWERVQGIVTEIVGDQSTSIEIDDAEYLSLLQAIAKGVPRRELVERIVQWKLESTERWLQRLGEQSRTIARRLNKKLEVRTMSHKLKLNHETWSPVWASLVHVIRNAVDHGIESPEERVAAGKPEAGTLELETSLEAERVVIRVSDDGQGIAWEALREKARELGLAGNTREDLVTALFSDGVSTKRSVSEFSGRGVGMAEVKQTCEDFGGSVHVESEPGEGTSFFFSFPKELLLGESSRMLDSVAAQVSLLPHGDAANDILPGRGLQSR